jgi:DNA polymerase III delta' subunit
MIRVGAPHAILLSGPAGVGKTTLAMDLAAGLLCTAPDGVARPCRSCRGCGLVAAGSHPDLHWLRPTGPGGQIVIGKVEHVPDTPPRGVRHLLHELALLPMEGGARLAIVESAHRMNEDAQGAILKTLEEPPPGLTIILCADEESRLLPTIRSRCARIRLGPVGPREIEAILADHGVADPPLAARLARLAGGRPGLALAYARAPEALRIRGEIARTLLDLLDVGPAPRLAAMRASLPLAMTLVAALDDAAAAVSGGVGQVAAVRSTAKGRRRPTSVASAPPDPEPTAPSGADGDDASTDTADVVDPDATVKAPPASQRRGAAEAIVTIWIDVARDLALAQVGATRSIHDPDLLEEMDRAARGMAPGQAATALARLERAATLLASNVAPELVLDGLALAWPRRQGVA